MAITASTIQPLQHKLLTAITRPLCMGGKEVTQVLLIGQNGEIVRTGYLELPDGGTGTQNITWEGAGVLQSYTFELPNCCDCAPTPPPVESAMRFFISTISTSNIQQLMDGGGQYLQIDFTVNYSSDFGNPVSYLWKMYEINAVNAIVSSSTDQTVTIRSSTGSGNGGMDFLDIVLDDGTNQITARIIIFMDAWDYSIAGNNLSISMTDNNMDANYEAVIEYNASPGWAIIESTFDIPDNSPATSVTETSAAPISLTAEPLVAATILNGRCESQNDYGYGGTYSTFIIQTF